MAVSGAQVRYSALAILLHWLIAALIVAQIVLAGRMGGRPTPAVFAVTQLHKSIGITVLILSLARLAWRLMHPPPPLPPGVAGWERRLARWTHVGFYLVMIGMPITGWIMVSTSRIAVPTLLYGHVPWPMIPGLPDLAPAAKKAWHTVGVQGHGLIIKFAYVLIALHVAGALKHQLIGPGEPVLSRMAPGAVTGRRAEPRILLIALGAVAVALGARFIQPPVPASAPQPQAPPAAEPAQQAALQASPQIAPPAAPAATPPAATVPPPATSPVTAKDPVRWIVEPGSSLAFESAWSGQAVRGRFDRWHADILFSPDAPERSKITVTVDVASVNTGDAQRDAALPSEDWFDGARHPKAVFTTSQIRKLGEGRFVARGALQLKGVTKPAELPFKLTLTGDRADARGQLVIDRTAFGVGQGEFAGTEQIPAAVTIEVHVRAKSG
jgi:cytochrome b561/polyisoprenoid-binding protein YceI